MFPLVLLPVVAARAVHPDSLLSALPKQVVQAVVFSQQTAVSLPETASDETVRFAAQLLRDSEVRCVQQHTVIAIVRLPLRSSRGGVVDRLSVVREQDLRQRQNERALPVGC